MKNNKYVERIIRVFDENEDLYNAHEKTAHILKEIVKDENFLPSVIQHNLNNPDFLKRVQHYPTLALSIYKDELIEILINIFPKLPNVEKNISFQSIHHHGNLMLSTIGLSGPGYDTIIFNKDYTINRDSSVSNMTISSSFNNKIGGYTFCDAYIPHVVFYPQKMSSTLVVWSKNKKSSINKAKQIPLPKNVKLVISKSLSILGFRTLLNLNDAKNHDFYVGNNKIMVLKERIGYPLGNNETYIQNFFHYLQSINFKDAGYLKELIKRDSTTEVERKWITNYLSKTEIEPKFLDIHLNISEKVNVKKEHLLNIYTE